MFQGLMTFVGGLAAIMVADAIRRWKSPKWWLALGYWFNAQAWGGRDDTLPFVEPSCWSRVLPASACRPLASFFLPKVEAPPESDEKDHLDHQMTEWFKVLESWKRITARHQQRARHPRGCRNPTNLRWCSQPNCQEVAKCRIISDRAQPALTARRRPAHSRQDHRARG